MKHLWKTEEKFYFTHTFITVTLSQEFVTKERFGECEI